tara:strand:- start:126 stop:623 length:498 start_codon:yes stop_codon:yes gene_type:complete
MNTRKSEVRSASTRERKTREENEWTYEEPNALDIPDQVMNRMANEGMSLRWIRIHLKGVDDYQNVGKKMAEGWTWVTPEEVPEMAISSVVQENGRYSGTVCRGDLALAKMPTGKLEARKRYYENKSQQLMNAVNAQLENSSDSRMPISNNSRSTVTRGRRPNFQE